jgi:hypothetical protein
MAVSASGAPSGGSARESNHAPEKRNVPHCGIAMRDRERLAGSNACRWYELQVMVRQHRGSAGGGMMRKMFHGRFAGYDRWPIGDTAGVMIARGTGRTGTFISARGTETDEERRRGAAVVFRPTWIRSRISRSFERL